MTDQIQQSPSFDFLGFDPSMDLEGVFDYTAGLQSNDNLTIDLNAFGGFVQHDFLSPNTTWVYSDEKLAAPTQKPHATPLAQTLHTTAPEASRSMTDTNPHKRKFECPVFVAEKRHGQSRTCNNIEVQSMSQVRRHLTRPSRGYPAQLEFLKLCPTCNEDIIDKNEFGSCHGHQGQLCDHVRRQRKGERAKEQWDALYAKVEVPVISKMSKPMFSENGLGAPCPMSQGAPSVASTSPSTSLNSSNPSTSQTWLDWGHHLMAPVSSADLTFDIYSGPLDDTGMPHHVGYSSSFSQWRTKLNEAQLPVPGPSQGPSSKILNSDATKTCSVSDNEPVSRAKLIGLEALPSFSNEQNATNECLANDINKEKSDPWARTARRTRVSYPSPSLEPEPIESRPRHDSLPPASSFSSHGFENSASNPDILHCDSEACRAAYSGAYRKSNLSRHIRLKHQGRKATRYCCEESACHKVFKRQDARLKHYRKQHAHRISSNVRIRVETI